MQTDIVRVRHRHEEWRRFMRVMFGRKVVIFGVVVIVLFIIIAIFAFWLAPYNPYMQDLRQTLRQPSHEHLLGTDWLGRDVLSRIIYGAQASLMVGIVAVGIASVFGITLGLIAAYFSGWLNTIIMRFTDALMSLPPIVLALAIAGALGGGLINLMISLGISLMPIYCRLMYGQVLSIKQADYIMAGRVIGSSDLRIMFFHIVPNSFPPLIVQMTLNLGVAILAEAGLSFLGLGIQPPGAAWGSMVSEGYRYLLANSLLSLAPGFCIMLLVLSFNLAGDGLRDTLDPRLRGTL